MKYDFLKRGIIYMIIILPQFLVISCQKDKTPPIIRIYSDIYNETQAMRGDTLLFDIRAEDENGLQELSLIKDGEPLQKVSGDQMSYNWFTASEDTGRHYFTIRAIDNEGNQSEDYLWVYLNDITFITVEGGSFLMGSEMGEDDAKPPHTVTLNSYQIMATEVTKGIYVCYLNDINAPKDGIVNGETYFSALHLSKHLDFEGPSYGVHRGEENHPIFMVTWKGAQAFAQWLNGRLPTEAEWEFAFRGGNESQGYLYSGSNSLEEVGVQAWDEYIYNVASKKPNELGIYDMSGGVLEWCQDYYQPDYYEYSPELNPQGPETSNGVEGYINKVVRGNSMPQQVEAGCTYFVREKVHWEFSITWEGLLTGFRVAREIE